MKKKYYKKEGDIVAFGKTFKLVKETKTKPIKDIQINRQVLTKFVKGTKLYLNNMDKLMQAPEGFLRGKLIAEEMNKFNISFDFFLHFGCDVELKKLQSILNKSFRL